MVRSTLAILLAGIALVLPAHADDRAGTQGQMAAECWSVGQDAAHPATLKIVAASSDKAAAAPPQTQPAAPSVTPPAVVTVDLRDLPKAAKVIRARLLVRRTWDPRRDDALDRCEVFALKANFEPGRPAALANKPLDIPGPWYDCFDTTEVVRSWAANPSANHGLLVKSLPGWDSDATSLEIAYATSGTGSNPVLSGKLPPQVKQLKVLHRAGQTFIAFQEPAPLLADEQPTWGKFRAALAEESDRTRFRIYQHTEPITAANLHLAKLLGEVGPLSGYNANGRNIEYVIGQAMIQPDEIGELARRKLDGLNADHPRMDRCPIPRLATPDGLLPPGWGLYIHSPAQAGKAWYAVVACRDGTENTRDISDACASPQAVQETVGAGEPVLQGDGLWGPHFDYPGRRKVYVQWTAPPLSPRPNMYFNWSVLVPPESFLTKPAPAELYFHRDNFSYAKPDIKLLAGSIQIAPHDYPFSGWHGYNDAAGTLRSCRDGKVSDHTQKRIAAFMEWAKKSLPIDARRIMAYGADGAAATAVAQPDLFSYLVLADFQSQVLNPKAAGEFAKAWGPKSPDVTDDADRSDWGWAWLDATVAASAKQPLPLMVIKGYSWGRFNTGFGKGRGRLYDALLKARQPLVADWSWASGVIQPPNKHTGLWRELDITNDMPMPAFTMCSRDDDKEALGAHNMGITWRAAKEDAGMFEIALSVSSDMSIEMTPRRCRLFKPEPGQTLTWEVQGASDAKGQPSTQPAGGRAQADQDGLVTVPLKLPRGTVVVRIRK